jgi:hypothetical protein
MIGSGPEFFKKDPGRDRNILFWTTPRGGALYLKKVLNRTGFYDSDRLDICG